MSEAHSFSPGYYIEKYLDERGWSQADLADIMGRPVQVINEIVNGRRGVSAETALGLAQAFGTTPQVWLNIDAAFQLSKVKQSDDDVALRAKVFSKGPIKEMVRRHWIGGSKDSKEMARQVVAFYGLKDIDEEPHFDAAARTGVAYQALTLPQIAWLHRARQVAEPLRPRGPFTADSLDRALAALREAASTLDSVGSVPGILSDVGIRFVIIEHLPKTRLDGACFWLKDGSPVIAMSMRYERVDYFWHTLFHELAHVLARDGLNNSNWMPDTDLPGTHTPTSTMRPGFEVAADEFAASSLIPQDRLEAFISASRPHFSRRRILDFARSLRVQPGVLVGQLQYRGEILYSHSRDLLVSVRDVITNAAVTDGWGQSVSA
jgi:HTH-type transcriptional regulator/antitoxin HigA